MTRREPDITQGGRCKRCGREFITLPRDLIDHYGLGHPCGGEIEPRAVHGENESTNQGEGK